MPKNTTPALQKKTEGNYELYLMRHGIAAARGTAGFADDSKRPLTPEGKAKLLKVVKGMDRVGFAVDWIVASPLVRALETAEVVAKSMASNPPVEVCDALRPGGSAEGLMAFLAKRPNRRKVLVVGHEPGLSELAARLIGSGEPGSLAFKKGGCCLISFDRFPPEGPGQLEWWLTPRLLRSLK